jgi:hypothetical protein
MSINNQNLNCNRSYENNYTHLHNINTLQKFEHSITQHSETMNCPLQKQKFDHSITHSEAQKLEHSITQHSTTTVYNQYYNNV